MHPCTYTVHLSRSPPTVDRYASFNTTLSDDTLTIARFSHKKMVSVHLTSNVSEMLVLWIYSRIWMAVQLWGLREALVSKAITRVCIDERVSSVGLLTKMEIVLNASLLSER